MGYSESAVRIRVRIRFRVRLGLGLGLDSVRGSTISHKMKYLTDKYMGTVDQWYQKKSIVYKCLHFR